MSKTMKQLYVEGLKAVQGVRDCAEYHNQYDGANFDLAPLDETIREIREVLNNEADSSWT